MHAESLELDAEILGYMYGWRANKFHLDDLALTSPLYSHIKWNSDKLTANCQRKYLLSTYQYWAALWAPEIDGPHDECPQDWCGCGFHAFDSLDSYLNGMDYGDVKDSYFMVLTLIKMWGTIIQHERGFRAQYVSVDAVFLTSEQMVFSPYIQQSIDAVIEPYENAVHYDRALPKPVEFKISKVENEDG